MLPIVDGMTGTVPHPVLAPEVPTGARRAFFKWRGSPNRARRASIAPIVVGLDGTQPHAELSWPHAFVEGTSWALAS